MSKNILIIDDEEIFLDLLKSYLETQDYEVTTSPTGLNILKLLFKKHFDAVLLDIWMVDKSGIEVLKEIKKANPDLPVILMTGYSASSLENTLKGLDIAGFAKKPFRLAEIEELISDVISGVHSPVAGENAQDSAPALEKENYKILIADDDDQYRDSLVEMFKENHISVLAAADGEEAYNLYKDNPEVNILVLDINMPKMNGIELLKKIKEENDKVTAIFITGIDNKELHMKLVEDRGAYAVFQKPFSYKHFLRFIEMTEQIQHAQDAKTQVAQ